MQPSFRAVKVSEHVHWVGAVDWGIRDFHGYSTQRGSTYNAFLIMADKITLMDAVKAPFKDELLARIASVIDPTKIDYVVSNHAEPDHSGSLGAVVEAVNPEKVFASPMGVKALAGHEAVGREVAAVKDGETLSLGNMDLTFIETRMLHWPDSMMSYLAADEILISQDGFGMHLATSERFADEIDEPILEEEGARYFANILMPYAPLVPKLVEKIQKLGISIRIIAPDHGPIWRKDAGKIIEWYGRWAEQKPTKKAVVVFDTMWRSTERMSRALEEGLTAGGASVKIMPLGSNHRSDVMTEILDAGAILVGSPTLNNNLFPTVADLLTYAKGLKPKNLIGNAFGSFGWSGEAVGHALTELEAMGVNLVGEAVKAKYVPDAAALEKCHALGLQVAQELMKV